jgi:hypothetical protein
MSENRTWFHDCQFQFAALVDFKDVYLTKNQKVKASANMLFP